MDSVAGKEGKRLARVRSASVCQGASVRQCAYLEESTVPTNTHTSWDPLL